MNNPELHEWYKDWFNTPYYHLLYRNRDHREAAMFIDRLIEYLHPQPDSRMLDLACGSGRHAIQLAEKGFEVAGVDLSVNSIKKALESADEQLDFFVHDMRLPFRIHYFDYIFNFFTSFGYFESVRDHQKAIQSMAIGLRENGTLIIDYLNPVYTEKILIPEDQDEAEGIHFSIRRKSDERFFYKHIQVRDQIKRQQFEYTERVSKIFLSEFETMLEQAGMKLIQVFGDYTLQRYDSENSKRMIMVAKKY